MASFSELWKNYPDHSTMKAMCTNKQKGSNQPFDDYCAIMLSECFNRSGVNISHFKGAKCWSHTGKKHILLAEDLANGLRLNTPAGFGSLKKILPADFQTILDGKTGVVFFKDYWRRGKESDANRSGDHIDLWNESRITSGSMLYRAIIELFGIVSDLNNCKEIWFWEVM